MSISIKLKLAGLISAIAMFLAPVAAAAANPFPVGQCTWWAYQMRPDVWNVSTANPSYPKGTTWNAYQWAYNAATYGHFPEGSTPVTGAIAVWPQGAYRSSVGHVAYVQSVAADASSYTVSEENFMGPREEDESNGGDDPDPGTRTIQTKSLPKPTFIYGGPAGNGPGQNPAPSSALGFVKLYNTSGTVEVHVDSLQGGSYRRVGDYTSDFTPGDASNGTWELFGSANGAPELGFVKLYNTSGTVEVHVDSLQGGSYRRVGDYTSDFTPGDASNGTWELFGSANGAPELGFVKLYNTSGTVEVHVDSLQGGSYRRVGDYTSDFTPGDASNGTWELFGSANGAPELGFVKLYNTSGTVEVHVDSLQGGSYRRVGDYTSDFTPGDASNGTWELFGSANGAPELGFVKLYNTSGTVEVHVDSLQGGSYRRVGDNTSDFTPGDANNGVWQSGTL